MSTHVLYFSGHVLERYIMEDPASGELVARELPELFRLLEDMKGKVLEVGEHVNAVKNHIQSAKYNTEKGISLLEVKNHMLLSYVINLTQLMLMKVEGHSIIGCGPVRRLVEIRTVLEKIRPLDQKLRYQIDKLIRTATTGRAASDPLTFRPNPGSLVSKLEQEEEEEGEGDSEEEENEGFTQQTRTYVPPKVVAVPYEDEKGQGKRRQQPHLRSSLIHDLRNELLDTPEEVHDVGSGVRRRREVQEERERERYEEEHFLRLSHPGGRHGEGGRATRDVMEELTDFSALKGLTKEEREGKARKNNPKRLQGKSGTRKGRRKKGSKRMRRQ